MDDLKKTLATMAASLQALGANTKALSTDLKETTTRLTARVDQMDENVTALNGTFASIQQHPVTLFERDAETQEWKRRMEARVDALEKRTPPAA